MFSIFVANSIFWVLAPLKVVSTILNWFRHHSITTNTLFSDHRCDVVQLISCLYPGQLKNQLHQATQKEDYTWSDLKLLADSIVASLMTSRMQCYDPLQGGKQIPPFNPVATPLSPPLKSGSTIPQLQSQAVPVTKVIHIAASITSTTTTTGVPIPDVYQPIKAKPAYEGKQRMPCANCKSDVPARHYYQQCQQLCIYPQCTIRLIGVIIVLC